MNKLPSTKALSIQDNIKSEFHFYFWKIEGSIGQFLTFPLYCPPKKLDISTERAFALKSKYKFFISEQRKLSYKYDIQNFEFGDFLNRIDRLVPERYRGKIKEIDDPLNKIGYVLSRYTEGRGHDKHIIRIMDRIPQKPKLYIVSYPLAVISLIEQKNYFSKKYIDFLKEYNRYHGIPFDKYIDEWIKKLLSSKGDIIVKWEQVDE